MSKKIIDELYKHEYINIIKHWYYDIRDLQDEKQMDPRPSQFGIQPPSARNQRWSARAVPRPWR